MHRLRWSTSPDFIDNIARLLGLERFDGESVALQIMDNGGTLAAIVYSGYRADPGSLEMSIWSNTPRWCQRGVLAAAFDYPFRQLGCIRVQATTAAEQTANRRFLARLGFSFEGVGRRAHHGGRDAAVYSMLPGECRWLTKQRTRAHEPDQTVLSA